VTQRLEIFIDGVYVGTLLLRDIDDMTIDDVQRFVATRLLNEEVLELIESFDILDETHPCLTITEIAQGRWFADDDNSEAGE
jgi:hypothetical protein